MSLEYTGKIADLEPSPFRFLIEGLCLVIRTEEQDDFVRTLSSFVYDDDLNGIRNYSNQIQIGMKYLEM